MIEGVKQGGVAALGEMMGINLIQRNSSNAGTKKKKH